jgi:nucleolar protein 56
MKAYIVTTLIGVFAVDEKNKILEFIPFPKDPVKVAEKLKRSEIELIEEEKRILQKLNAKKISTVFGYRKEGVKFVEPENTGEKFVKENLRKLAVEKKFVKDQLEFNQFLSKVNIELTKIKIKKAVGRDKLVINAANAIEEIDKTTNILVERLREWYGLHFPEMDRAIASHEKFAKLVSKFGSREKIEDEVVEKIREGSMGADFLEVDIEIIRKLADQILQLFDLREKISKYLEKTLKEIAPNFSELAGPLLAAKLIAKAGGLEKLAKMPSSTIQILGAEKALFRFLHGKGKAPRHGLIFSHPLIQNAKDEQRGKIARVLASKLSIAAKLDFYSKKYIGDKLKKELLEKIKQI